MKLRNLIFAALVALGSIALAQTTSVTTTVTSSNTMTVKTTSLTFTPTSALADEDATTTIDYATNDGVSHKISVKANLGGWTFTPSTTGSTTAVYPVLTFVSSSTTGGGTVNTVAADLISSGNVESAGADVLTAIKNTSGTITVTLRASITDAVTAGSYSATLTYTLN